MGAIEDMKTGPVLAVDPDRLLLRAVVDGVQHCNLRCLYCHPGEVWRKQHLDADRIAAVFAAAEAAGLLEVVLSGGEITLHPQLDRVLYATSLLRRTASTLITNATLVDAEMAAQLGASNLTRICVSNWSWPPKTYSRSSPPSPSTATSPSPNRKAVRYRLLHVAGRITSHARRTVLAVDRTWPWADALLVAFARIRALPGPRRLTGTRSLTTLPTPAGSARSSSCSKAAGASITTRPAVQSAPAHQLTDPRPRHMKNRG